MLDTILGTRQRVSIFNAYGRDGHEGRKYEFSVHPYSNIDFDQIFIRICEFAFYVIIIIFYILD